MADGPQNLLGVTHGPIYDFQGAPSGDATWVKLESLVADLKVERDYLREMLRLALASNQESGLDS